MQRPHDNRTRGLPPESESDDETARSVSELYQQQLLTTLQQAIQTDYNGVDIVHLDQESRAGRSLTTWQATKWETEPPASAASADGYQRYDFRYYDRDTLLASLSHGKWPGP